MTRILFVSKDQLQYMYCVEGVTDDEIASRCGVSCTIIGDLRKLYGIKALSRVDRLKLKGCLTQDDLTEEVLRREYTENLLTINPIAKKYHIKPTKVSKLLHQYNIPVIRNQIFLRRSDISFTEEQKQIIYGSLCGDASISISDGSGSCYFEVSHCKVQKEYLLWKSTILKNLLSHSEPYLYDSNSLPGYDKVYESYEISTFVAPIFNELRTLYYPNGKKVISREVLDNLTELGLAVWYMDDGSFAGCKYSTRYAVAGKWSVTEMNNITDWFRDRWRIDIKFHDQGEELSLGVKAAAQFRSHVEPYIIPSMRYKLAYSK